MKAIEATPPQVLLATESLLGLSRAPRDRLLQITARFAEPESLAVTFSKAMQAGAGGVLASPTRALSAALAELRHTVPIYALLPNMPEYARDAVHGSLAAALGNRIARAGLGTRLSFAMAASTRVLAMRRGDFAALLPMLLRLEVASFRRKELRGIVIAAPITDLCLAGGHRRFFETTIAFIRRRFRAAAAFETHNLGHLLRALREWAVRPDFVVGPVNPGGLMMKPSPVVVLEELARAEVPVLAKELRAGCTMPLLEGGRYALSHGAYGLVPDLVEVEDLVNELQAFGRMRDEPPARDLAVGAG